MSRLCAPMLVCLLSGSVQLATAQNYPVKPIRIIVPSAPAGTSDIMGRLLANKLTEQTGQQVIVENRAGAGGTIGYDLAARAAPDGYTILIAPASIAINVSMYSKLPYSLRDFAPITLMAAATNVVAVHPSVPATNLKSLLALARAQPGALVAGSAGLGTSPHLSMELLKSMTRTNFVIVHYKGSGQQMIGLLAGEHAIAFPTLPTIMPFLKQQRIRGVAVTAAKRSGMVPDMPTVAETVPGYESTNWFSLLAPAGTPQPVIDRLHQEVTRALRSPELHQRITTEGAEIIANTPAELASFMKSESAKWAQVIKAAGIKAD